VGPRIVQLLSDGTSVARDFQANTKDARAWMRGLFEEAGAEQTLHHFYGSEEVCLSRLEERNASGTHEYQVSKSDFRLSTATLCCQRPLKASMSFFTTFADVCYWS
jgi:predicted kinase